MSDLMEMDAKAILAVPVDEPERLFGADPSKLPDAFRRLAKLWHPDRSSVPGAEDVFKHVSRLHALAEKRAASGDWKTPGIARFEANDGRVYEIRYAKKHDFELGEIYVGRNVLAYALRREFDDLHANAIASIGSLAYADQPMRDTFEKRMPSLAKSFIAKDRAVLAMRKTSDQVLLRDLLIHCGGRLEPAHVAWIVSELESLTAYLSLPIVDVVNPDLGPDTLLVSPRHHSVAIAGGWWCAAKAGRKLALTGRAVAHIPPIVVGDGTATHRQSLEMIRLVASESLGRPDPVRARRDTATPKPFGDWLVQPSPKSALDDYQSWCAARDASFGPRKFREFAVDVDAVYRRV